VNPVVGRTVVPALWVVLGYVVALGFLATVAFRREDIG
jgi:hypothetical protein